MKKLSLTTIVMAISITFVLGQNNASSDALSPQKEKQFVTYKHSIGASLFMLSNFFPETADYYLLTYGYQATQKDRVFVEFNTWKYAEPLGTYGNSKENYPGFVRAFGVGAGYQRFLWKGLFTAVEATPFMKQYYDASDQKIQKGFQLYLQLIAGYRFEFFKKRWYIEPAYAIKYWPVNTNVPSDFEEIDEGTPIYIFEPSLNYRGDKVL